MWRERIWLVAGAYACVALCYCGFFAMPVTPAELSDASRFVIRTPAGAVLFRIDETLYTNGKAFIAVATIRTISAPSSGV